MYARKVANLSQLVTYSSIHPYGLRVAGSCQLAFGDLQLAYCHSLMSPGDEHPQSHQNTHWYHVSTAVLQSHNEACRYREFPIPPCRCVANARCTENASPPIKGHKSTPLHDRSGPRRCFVHTISGRGRERPKWFGRYFMCITS